MCEARLGRSFDVMTPLAELKQTHRATWAAGDYPVVAQRVDEVPPRDLLDRIDVRPGEDVLDVATGTGNVALRAAAAGANVVGLDLTPELFATAWRRMDEWGVAVDWVEGDAEELPFDDESFDVVLSVFGVQFAPRHQIVARELARVCRPGGRIGLVNWTPAARSVSSSRSWAPTCPCLPRTPRRRRCGAAHRTCAACLRVRESSSSSPAGTTRGNSGRPRSTSRFMETNYGPTLKARERLSAEGRWQECREEIRAMAERHNEATDGGLLMHAEYMVAIGVKA